jgi:hypothetical protein
MVGQPPANVVLPRMPHLLGEPADEVLRLRLLEVMFRVMDVSVL